MNVGLSAGQFSCLPSVSASSPQKSRNACFCSELARLIILFSLSLAVFSSQSFDDHRLGACTFAYFFFSRFISSCPPFFMSAMTLVCFGSFSYLARFGCWVVFWQKTTLVYTLFLFSSLSDFLLFPSHSHLIIAWKMQMGSLSILICGASGDHNDCHEFSVSH